MAEGFAYRLHAGVVAFSVHVHLFGMPAFVTETPVFGISCHFPQCLP